MAPHGTTDTCTHVHVHNQEALLKLGHIKETRNYFYYRFRGLGGLEPRASVSSGQMAAVLASRHPLLVASEACAHLPAWPLGCYDGLPGSLLGLGVPTHTGWKAQGRGLVGSQDWLKVCTET